ncbi:MAG TPA: phosphatase PAP2 family protein, partial [Micromonosporaceae bacterium]
MNHYGFRVVNDFARQTDWLHGVFEFLATYGIALFVPVLLAGWWRSRIADAPRRLAGLLWAPIAALLAVAIAQPISGAVGEQRPFVGTRHVLTLVRHAADAGFPSDHATASGALAVGILLASRRLGWMAALLGALIAFSRVYVGVHYPVDVVAGLLLGAAVALLGRAPATWLLERPVLAVKASRFAILVRSGAPLSLVAIAPEVGENDRHDRRYSETAGA